MNLAPEGKDDPAVWPEFLSKLKESIVTAFDEAVVEKEEEVKRGEAQRLMVGWNFCTWFLVKVSVYPLPSRARLHSRHLLKYQHAPRVCYWLN